MNNEKQLTRTVYDSRAVVKNLAPGTEYFFQLRTVKGLDSSVAVEKKVVTSKEIPYNLSFFFFLKTSKCSETFKSLYVSDSKGSYSSK